MRKNKLFPCFIAFVLVMQFFNITGLAVEKYSGDIDGDGVVSVDDARLLLGIAAGITPSSRKIVNKCDIDGDYIITVSDAISVLRMACGIDDVVLLEKNNEIILSGLPKGSYALKYEDENGVISDYEDICTLNVSKDNEEVYYDKLIVQNSAPVEAMVIGVYSADGVRVSEIQLDDLRSCDLGEKQYSFGAISDAHIGAKTSETDLKNALRYFEDNKDIEFTTVCGDLSLGGTEANLSLYKKIVDENTSKPVYAVSGNHETNASFAPLGMDSLKPYTNQDLYYSFEVNNDVFIMLGMHDVRAGYEFAEGELQWLYEVLEENRNKRCFLFLHLYPRDGSGDALDLDLEGDMLSNTQGEVFYSLISHYPNVIYFHGHSHESLRLQAENGMNNYDDIFGCHSIHIPSVTYPKYLVDGKLVTEFDASEGYVVDVYENNVVLRGRDFVTGKFMPIATYCLDTTPKGVDGGKYYDPTGTILNENSNVLKGGNAWYNSEFDKGLITEISFVDSYDGEYDECWDATLAQNNNVLVYRNNTELFIKCFNEAVVANSDSTEMFAGFKSLIEINNFLKFDAARIIKIESMFKDCNSIKTLDLSRFDGVNPENMKGVFWGCSSLENIDISMLNLTGVNVFQNMCNGCSSLERIEFPDIDISKTIYLSSTFSGCTSLKTVDMSKFSGTVYYGSTFSGCTALESVEFGDTVPVNMNNMFFNCSSIKTIDLSKFVLSQAVGMSQSFKNCRSLELFIVSEDFNTSKVTNMRSTFENCPLLNLDCSTWDTSKTNDITYFNRGSPNVISPTMNN